MKRYNPTAEILNAICALNTGNKIRATFENGQEAVYSDYMLDLLASDPNVQHVTSETTGEILYYKEV